MWLIWEISWYPSDVPTNTEPCLRFQSKKKRPDPPLNFLSQALLMIRRVIGQPDGFYAVAALFVTGLVLAFLDPSVKLGEVARSWWVGRLHAWQRESSLHSCSSGDLSCSRTVFQSHPSHHRACWGRSLASCKVPCWELCRLWGSSPIFWSVRYSSEVLWENAHSSGRRIQEGKIAHQEPKIARQEGKIARCKWKKI